MAQSWPDVQPVSDMVDGAAGQDRATVVAGAYAEPDGARLADAQPEAGPLLVLDRCRGARDGHIDVALLSRGPLPYGHPYRHPPTQELLRTRLEPGIQPAPRVCRSS